MSQTQSSDLISFVVDFSAPQDFLSELQKQTSDVLIWNGYDGIYNRFEAIPDLVKEYFDTINSSPEKMRVDFSSEDTLEISHGSFICWSSHPLVFEYFGKKHM